MLGKEDARSSEQHATREQASGNDGMTPKFDGEISFAASGSRRAKAVAVGRHAVTQQVQTS
jgi:hypothetical protein